MIDTFFSLGQLGSTKALFMSLVIGAFFGVALEKAGFGSSRRLSGVFYFKDMAVIKVMFTAMITAVIGISLCLRFGIISQMSIYLNPTLYTAQILGGIIFGVGFVMGGWCPGTAAVGAASGKWDAFIFLGGVFGGSIFFNETFSLLQGLYRPENQHTLFVYQSLGIAKEWFILMFVIVGVAVFWGAELIEKRTTRKSEYLNSAFLKRFSFILIVFGFCVFILSGESASVNNTSERSLLTQVDNALDHIEPEELARRILSGQEGLVVVDVRPEAEFMTFHIKSARNILLKDLVNTLEPHRNKGIIVLYSNGMTHPAQARDSLFRLGFNNVYLLTDGLDGFISRCLKPVSLRSEPVPQSYASEINQWRQFFLGPDQVPSKNGAEQQAIHADLSLPGVIDAPWLEGHLQDKGLRIIDLRSQPEYNTSHIPGAFALNIESLRGNINGVPSCLLPSNMLVVHLSLMGIEPQTLVVLVYGDKVQDATLAGMAFERLGHQKYALLSGGFMKWKALGLPTDAILPEVRSSAYPQTDKDQFTIDYKGVLSHTQNKTAVIIDVRPEAYYTGEKSDEARAGHIPGAINRPFDADTVKTADTLDFRPATELAAIYEKMIAEKQTQVIVHCRTGHQASQTFFVLKHLLGYKKVLWYDAGWTQWATRMELPVETGKKD